MTPSRLKNNLLIVGNFSSNTGYAWNTIGEYFFALGQMFIEHGNRAMICYPEVHQIPQKYQSSKIELLKFDFSTGSLISLFRFLKRNHVGTLYLTDRPVFSLKYIICRLAGVWKIVVHDRTSGDRDTPGPFKRLVKRSVNQYPIMSADLAIAISDFVKGRLIRTSCFPENRTVKIWNGINIEKFAPGNDDFVFRKYNIPKDKKVIFAYSRANQYKGIQVLIEAADILINRKNRDDVFFLFCGDGPDLEFFRSLIAQKHLSDDFLCPGMSNAIARILKGVSIVVVPSIWQEGFGLSVVEAMATGKPVLASRVGGIVEIIDNCENGYLFPPGDSEALSERILNLVENEGLRKTIGISARATVAKRFNIEDKKKELLKTFNKIISQGQGHDPFSSPQA